MIKIIFNSYLNENYIKIDEEDFLLRHNVNIYWNEKKFNSKSIIIRNYNKAIMSEGIYARLFL